MLLKLKTAELHSIIHSYVAELGLDLSGKDVTITINADDVDIEVLPQGTKKEPVKTTRKKASSKIETATDAFLQADPEPDETPEIVASAAQAEAIHSADVLDDDDEVEDSIFGQKALDEPVKKQTTVSETEHSIFG